MSVATMQPPIQALNLPTHRDPYYAGKWQKPAAGRYAEVTNPATAESLGKVVDGTAADAEAAIAAAKAAFANGGACLRRSAARCCARSPTCCASTAMSWR